jgi:membrane protease YdiL (CAAX protease family)
MMLLIKYHATSIPYGNTSLSFSIIIELVLLLLFYTYCKFRRIENIFNFQFGSKELLYGILLFFISFIFFILVFPFLIILLVPDYQDLKPVFGYDIKLSFPLIIILSIVNGYFEELFLIRYTFAVLEKFVSIVSVFAISTLIRSSYHTYQGLPGVLFVMCMGIIFCLTYYKFKTFEPIVISHVLWDIFSLSYYS